MRALRVTQFGTPAEALATARVPLLARLAGEAASPADTRQHDRNISPDTLKVYRAAVANFSAFDGRSADKLGVDGVRAHCLHLIECGF